MKENMLSDEFLYYYLDSVQILSYEDERELLIQYKENPNSDLEFKLFNQYAKYIFKKAKRCCSDSTRYTISDLFQEGYIGFKIALDRYDINSGNKFLSYASWWIDRFIKDFVNRNRFDFYIPRSAIYEILSFANDADDLLYNNLNKSKYELYRNLLRPIIQLDDIMNEDCEDTKINYVLSEPNFDSCVITNDRDQRLQNIIDIVCKERTADMIRMYYGLEPYNKQYTVICIGDKYNVSKQYVSNTIIKAVKKINTRINCQREYYDF